MYKDPIVIAIDLKGKLKYVTSAFQIYTQKITLTNLAYFAQIYCHTLVQKAILSGASGAQTSKICVSVY